MTKIEAGTRAMMDQRLVEMNEQKRILAAMGTADDDNYTEVTIAVGRMAHAAKLYKTEADALTLIEVALRQQKNGIVV